MMDEIRNNCARLLSEDFAEHSAAYLWLRKCEPFQRLVERFRQHDLNLFDIAAALAPGGNRPFSGVAVGLLEELLAMEATEIAITPATTKIRALEEKRRYFLRRSLHGLWAVPRASAWRYVGYFSGRRRSIRQGHPSGRRARLVVVPRGGYGH